MNSSQLINSVADTTAHRDRDELDVSITHLLMEYTEADVVAVYRLIEDRGRKRFCCGAMQRRGEEVVGPEDNLSSTTLEDIPAWNECVLTRDVVQYSKSIEQSCIVFPIKNERDVVGIIELNVRGDLKPREKQLIDAILRIMKNHLSLLDYGECDSLTGLRNRKTFEASFAKLNLRLQETRTSIADDESYWLGIVDIDKFKSINDNYGHLFGDEVLLLLGRLMKQNFRGTDQVFRFGGEEFVIVLDRATVPGASIAFERLRTTVENYTFPQVGRVTISLGYTYIDPQDAPATCVERADEALYYAKHHGRNQVCCYETLIATGALASKKVAQSDVELF